MDDANESHAEANTPPATAPEQFPISLRGFENEDRAKNVGNLIGSYIRELSRYIDLSGLDGVTIAFDYAQALQELDRGFETSHRLTPTDGDAVGIAMTPRVKRAGKVKSHIVIMAELAGFLEDPEGEQFKWVLHTLAHECAHVEITARFDTAFPGVLLAKAYDNMLDGLRWKVILACWEEYAANWISATVGENRIEADETVFLRRLEKARSEANTLIKEYRIHGDVNRILTEVFSVYGDLMKFACYQLGTMRGRALTLDDLPRTKAALTGHWFEPHFHRLNQLCQDIADSYSTWTDQEPFEALGSLAEAIVVENGVIVTRRAGNDLWVDIPFSSETMPD